MLSPALAVIVRDLGLEANIVARHGFDIVLDKSIPVAGDQSGLDYEILLTAKPTHVLLEWGQREIPRRLGELMVERGVMSPTDVFARYESIRQRVQNASEAAAQTKKLQSAEEIVSNLLAPSPSLKGSAPASEVGP